MTAISFVISYIYWPGISETGSWNSQQVVLFGFWLIFLVGFMSLAVYDLKWQLLPNKIVYRLMAVAAIQALLLVFVFNGGSSQFWQIVFSIAIGGGIFYAFFQISGGKWIGGGDVKLGTLLGLILADPSLSLLTIFIASIVGSLVALPLLATKKVSRSTRIPFGPFLIVGAIVAQLFGAAIINWYKSKIYVGL